MLTNNRPPLNRRRLDLSGQVKAEYLECFLLIIDNWITAYSLHNGAFRQICLRNASLRGIGVQLGRYHKQGLLDRRKSGRWFEYKLTLKGWKRLLFLWKRLNSYRGSGTESARKVKELRLKIAAVISEQLIYLLKRGAQIRPSSILDDLLHPPTYRSNYLDVLDGRAPAPPLPPDIPIRRKLLTSLALLKGVSLPHKEIIRRYSTTIDRMGRKHKFVEEEDVPYIERLLGKDFRAKNRPGTIG